MYFRFSVTLPNSFLAPVARALHGSCASRYDFCCNKMSVQAVGGNCADTFGAWAPVRHFPKPPRSSPEYIDCTAVTIGTVFSVSSY
jgi:hypothetical protein